MAFKDAMLLIREKFRIKEMEPVLENLADALIEAAPSPIQVIQALGSILAGGFPLIRGGRNTRVIKS